MAHTALWATRGTKEDMPTTYTPLRYPGGKSGVYPFVKTLTEAAGLGGATYTEPFAGGAGLAIKLLLKNDVESIHLNDMDPAIYFFWESVIHRTSEICSKIENVDISIPEWHRQRSIFKGDVDASDLELGFATLFLNRTNVSGVLKGGVIGGVNQSGPSKMNARFNKAGLIKKIQSISRYRSRIRLTCEDAVDMLRKEDLADTAFLNVDPPYVKQGPALYRSFFAEKHHTDLHKVLTTLDRPWILTYDDTPFIRELYSDHTADLLPISYSIGRTRKTNEVVFFSDRLSILIKEGERHARKTGD